jgi:formylglycine-generating enzyme required for sulfatase activity/serine/threonine protein kinase
MEILKSPDHYCLYCCLPKGRTAGCEVCGPGATGKDVEAHPMFLPPGTILEKKYLIGRVLGFGGFGVTYLALDINLDMRVAIKEYLPTGENLASRHTDRLTVAPYPGKAEDNFAYGLQKFIEEGRALAQFTNHPNVVSVLNFFEAHGTAYLVMSFIEGLSLDDHLKNRGGRLPEAEAVQITTMILDGLKAVHKRGLLHRDISPDNVFLTEEGQVQLIDFGSARAAIGRHSTNISKIVKAGYSPFEQYRTEAREAEYTDLYAVGATLYRMLTGRKPPAATDRQHADTLADPGNLVEEVASSNTGRIVLKALAMSPEDRFQSAAEMLAALWPDPTPAAKRPTEMIEKAPSLAPEASPAPIPETTPAPTPEVRPAPIPETTPEPTPEAQPAPAPKSEVKPEPRVASRPDHGSFLRRSFKLVESVVGKMKRLLDRLPSAKAFFTPKRLRWLAAAAVAVALVVLGSVAYSMYRRWVPIEQEFVEIPAGRFKMGSSVSEKHHEENETHHWVTISRPFLIGATEVTQGQWQDVMGENPSSFKKCGVNCPVEEITWWDALAYANALSLKEGLPECYVFEDCEKEGFKRLKCFAATFVGLDCLGYRLPTEAEWEYAARAGTTTPYHTGQCLTTDQANFNGARWRKDGCPTGARRKRTIPVASLAKNDWGLYDVHGNVSEWVWDWENDYPEAAVTDPTGPPRHRHAHSGNFLAPGERNRADTVYGTHTVSAITRGGSWRSSSDGCRLAYRTHKSFNQDWERIGFRLARSLP